MQCKGCKLQCILQRSGSCANFFFLLQEFNDITEKWKIAAWPVRRLRCLYCLCVFAIIYFCKGMCNAWEFWSTIIFRSDKEWQIRSKLIISYELFGLNNSKYFHLDISMKGCEYPDTKQHETLLRFTLLKLNTYFYNYRPNLYQSKNIFNIST